MLRANAEILSLESNQHFELCFDMPCYTMLGWSCAAICITLDPHYWALLLTLPTLIPPLALLMCGSPCARLRLDFEALEIADDCSLDKAKSWSRSIEDLHQNGCNTLVRSARQSVLRYVPCVWPACACCCALPCFEKLILYLAFASFGADLQFYQWAFSFYL